VKEGESEPEPNERRPFYHPDFLTDLTHWKRTAPNIATRVTRIVDETLKTPFTGIGKPEPLTYGMQGQWSRRLTRRDRIVYRVSDEVVEFLSARGHYGQH
jgi:toxin YoeB